MRPIKPMPAQAGTTTHLDLIDKINEIIDRVNYITYNGNLPRYTSPQYEGESAAMNAKWRRLEERVEDLELGPGR